MINNRVIVVNAVASIHSGAYAVLKNFILNAIHTEFYFLVFTGVPIDIPERCNVKIIIKRKRTGLNRIYWDYFELNRELKLLKCVPDLVFSLQNTDFIVDQLVPHVVFFHNPFMLYDQKWNVLKKNERLFWFYKIIYRLIVQYSLNKHAVLIVQSQWARRALIRRGFLSNSIKVFKELRSVRSKRNANFIKGESIHLFYPATPLLYKNHKFLFDLMIFIKNSDSELFSRIKLNLTISEEDLKTLKLMNIYQTIEDSVILHGYINQSIVEDLYRKSDMLVFPSLIETLGLPLVEASEFCMKILAIDLEYSREVLMDYENVVFLDCSDPQKWVESIKDFVPAERSKSQVFTKGDFTSWRSVFDFFNELISRYEGHV